MGGGAAAFVAAAPSDQIGLGVIGSGGRGTYVMFGLSERPGDQGKRHC